MNAPEYLQFLKNQERIHTELLNHIPPNAGGSDLRNLPVWLRESLKKWAVSDMKSFFKEVLSKHDWAIGEHKSLIHNLPPSAKSVLTISDTFAVGSTTSSEFNGAAIKTPDKQGWVVVLPTGAERLLHFVSGLIGIYVSEDLANVVIRGGKDLYGVPENFMFPLKRRLFSGIQRHQLQKSYPLPRGSCEIQSLLKRYVSLGVVDPSDLLCGYLPLPLPLSLEFAGHPLEPGNWLAQAAIRFLLLHEYAHVLLQHESEIMGETCEFAADAKAVQIGAEAASSLNARSCNWIGAYLFLRCAGWIRDLESNTSATNTHPHPHSRWEKLKQCMESSCADPHTKQLVQELETIFDAAWRESAILRSDVLKDVNSMDLLLERCVETGPPEMLMDQFPRWILAGVPWRICQAFGRSRARLEMTLRDSPGDEHARAKLNLLMQAFQVAAQGDSDVLHESMERAYAEAKQTNS